MQHASMQTAGTGGSTEHVWGSQGNLDCFDGGLKAWQCAGFRLVAQVEIMAGAVASAPFSHEQAIRHQGEGDDVPGGVPTVGGQVLLVLDPARSERAGQRVSVSVGVSPESDGCEVGAVACHQR